ncbi:outer membrane protein assembly factor BamB [Luteimonas qiangzhengi]
MKSVNTGMGTALLRGALVLSCAVALAGCGTVRDWFGGSDDEPSATEPMPLQDFTESASAQRIWSTGVGKGERRIGARQGPAIANGRVYAAALSNGVRALDLQSGSTLWHYDSDLQLAGTPGVGEGVVAVGSLEGKVVALDADTGAELWSSQLGNEVIAAPAIGQGLVVVRSNDGRITAFDARSGAERWFWVQELPTLTVRGNDAPTIGPGYVFVGNDDGTVIALSMADGQPIWQQQVGMPDGRTELERMADIDGSPVLDNVTLYASSYRGQTMAIEAPSGRPRWVSDRGGPGRLAQGFDRLVIADRHGTVWALDKNSGSSLWQQPALARRNLTSAAIHDNHAVVGDFDGYLHWLRMDNGELAARARAGRHPIKGAPLVADGILVVQTVRGDLSAYRLQR